MEQNFDVFVAGGGVAGFCAAVQAGRLGLKTILVEKEGMAGGILTVGGNHEISQFFSGKDRVIEGIGWEYCKRLEVLGGAQIPDVENGEIPIWYDGVIVNIPLAAYLMDEMLTEAGVTICYEQTVASAETEEAEDGNQRITKVFITSKDGLIPVTAKTYIDCTGDGDLSVFAGASCEPYEYRTDGSCALQPGTVRYYISSEEGLDAETADRLLSEALSEGRLQAADYRGNPYDRILEVSGDNLNHVSGFDFASSEGKTAANIAGRQLVARMIAALRKSGKMPNIKAISNETAVRETRRITCDTCISAEDYAAARVYPDGICTAYYPIDLHRDNTENTYNVFTAEGKVPQIPLSAMTVKGLSNLYVAGRCICGDRLANSAYRVKASCMAMGQATAAAAYVAVTENDGKTRGIALEKVKNILKENGAIVPNL